VGKKDIIKNPEATVLYCFIYSKLAIPLNQTAKYLSIENLLKSKLKAQLSGIGWLQAYRL
jgi:hypothetical protein